MPGADDELYRDDVRPTDEIAGDGHVPTPAEVDAQPMLERQRAELERLKAADDTARNTRRAELARAADEELSRRIAAAAETAARRSNLEQAAESARLRLVSLVMELAAETDPAAIRDRAIGVAALTTAIEGLDELADRELVHRAVLRRWRDEVAALLADVAGTDLEGIRYGSPLEGRDVTIEVHATEEAALERIRHHGARRPDRLTFYGALEGVLRELEDRVGRAGEEG